MLRGRLKKFSSLRDTHMNQCSKSFLFDQPGRYRIHVQGQLSASWTSRLSDMVITVKQPENQQPTTILTGKLRDQTALMGILNALYAMGCPLLKVERLNAVSSTEDVQDDEVKPSE
jgi:hypothetical protein